MATVLFNSFLPLQEDNKNAKRASDNSVKSRIPFQDCDQQFMNVPPPPPTSSSDEEAKDAAAVAAAAAPSNVAAPASASDNNLVIEVLERPKRPLSAYNFFFQRERQKYLAENSTQGESGKVIFSNMGKAIAERWNALDDASREPYQALAKEEKARHKKAMAEWRKINKEQGDGEETTAASKKKARRASGSKRRRSSSSKGTSAKAARTASLFTPDDSSFSSRGNDEAGKLHEGVTSPLGAGLDDKNPSSLASPSLMNAAVVGRCVSSIPPNHQQQLQGQQQQFPSLQSTEQLLLMQQQQQQQGGLLNNPMATSLAMNPNDPSYLVNSTTAANWSENPSLELLARQRMAASFPQANPPPSMAATSTDDQPKQQQHSNDSLFASSVTQSLMGPTGAAIPSWMNMAGNFAMGDASSNRNIMSGIMANQSQEQQQRQQQTLGAFGDGAAVTLNSMVPGASTSFEESAHSSTNNPSLLLSNFGTMGRPEATPSFMAELGDEPTPVGEAAERGEGEKSVSMSSLSSRMGSEAVDLFVNMFQSPSLSSNQQGNSTTADRESMNAQASRNPAMQSLFSHLEQDLREDKGK